MLVLAATAAAATHILVAFTLVRSPLHVGFRWGKRSEWESKETQNQDQEDDFELT
jgi:hypothetical protein